MRRWFSIMSRLGLSAENYTTAERQLRQSALDSLEDKLTDMKLLGSGWKIMTDFLEQSSSKVTSNTNPETKMQLTEERESNPIELAMEVQDFLKNENIECVIGGSLALATFTQPRMTKDVDLNIKLTELEFGLLKNIFEKNGHPLSDWHRLKGKSGIKPPYDKEFAGVSILEYKGIRMDLFLNTCTATRWVHESAIVINNRKFVSMECLAYFKLFGINPNNNRYHKDMNDLVNIFNVKGFRSDIVESRLIEVFGVRSRQVSILRSLVKRREANRNNDSWWNNV